MSVYYWDFFLVMFFIIHVIWTIFTNLHSYYLNTLYTLTLTPMCFIEKFEYRYYNRGKTWYRALYIFFLEFLNGSSMLKIIQINIVSQEIHTQNDISYLNTFFFMFPRLICPCLSIEFHFDIFFVWHCLTFHIFNNKYSFFFIL